MSRIRTAGSNLTEPLQPIAARRLPSGIAFVHDRGISSGGDLGDTGP